MVYDLTKPNFRRVLLDGRDVTGDSVDSRNATILSQTYALFPHLNVYDDVIFASRIKGWSKDSSKQIVMSMLHMVHLEQKAGWKPGELFRGQQHIALAKTLASESKILLLNEVLRALDTCLRINLRKELRSLTKDVGLTRIHMEETVFMLDWIVVMRYGAIAKMEIPLEIYRRSLSIFTANFIEKINLL